MCLFKLSGSVHSMMLTLALILCASENAFWLCVSSNYLHSSLHSMKLTLALLTHESYTIEITTILCSSDSALWLCVSSNYLVQCMNFPRLLEE